MKPHTRALKRVQFTINDKDTKHYREESETDLGQKHFGPLVFSVSSNHHPYSFNKVRRICD